jgi:hypothetical protein
LDEFLLDTLDLHPVQVVAAVRSVAARTGRSGPALTPLDVAAHLESHGLAAFAGRLITELGR